MEGLWDFVESWLAARGVRRVYTHDFDPIWESDPEWWRDFLKKRGYRRVKQLGKVGVVEKCLDEKPRGDEAWR
jgi:hypothetical protein